MSRERDSEERDPPKRESSGAPPSDQYKCFVGGISWHLKDDDLKDMFRKFDATDAYVMIDKNNGKSRGFGFVMFKDKEGMEDAIRKYHDTEFEGRKVSVRRAIPQEQTAPGTPAAALAAGRRYDRDQPRGRVERGGGHRGGGGYDRGGPYERGYDRGGGYDNHRGGYGRGPYDRPPYEEYRGYPPAAYGYDHRAADPYGYSREYAPRDPYADRYAGGGYADPYAYERAAAYPPAAYPDRYAAERGGGGGYPPPAGGRGGGPERDYRGGGGGYGAPPARGGGPYDRATVADDRRTGSR